MKDDDPMGLFEHWLEIERATGRPMAAILAELNAACGSKYRHNWPSVMAARGYSLDRCPTNVRRYMMRVVLPGKLMDITGKKFTDEEINSLIELLT